MSSISPVAPLLSSAYAPSIGYFKLLSLGACSVDGAEHFVKQTYRNRCYIACSDGVCELVIPVEKGASSTCPIRDVVISEHNHWRSKHIQAIISSYSATPFFEYYADDIFAVYEDKSIHSLFEFNWLLTHRLAQLMHLPLQLDVLEHYVAPSNVVGADYRSILQPKHPACSSLFGIPPYYQRFVTDSSLIYKLSVLDLLFNMGPETLLVLHNVSVTDINEIQILK